MKCPYQVPLRDKTDVMGNQLYRPCGMCAVCRRNNLISIQQRGIYEWKKHKYSSFLTLTYDDNHLKYLNVLGEKINVGLPTTCKKDVQVFIDSLRHYVKRHNCANCDCDFSHIYATEYGGRLARPHVHLLLFGVDFPIAKKIASKLWSHGFVDSRAVHSGSIRYVCKYINKGAKGKYADLQYHDNGVEKPVVKWSRGFGSGFYYDNIDSIKKNGCVVQGNKRFFVPSYYRNKLSCYNEPMLFKQEIEKQTSWVARHNLAKHYGFDNPDDMYRKMALNSINSELKYNISHKLSVDLEEF